MRHPSAWHRRSNHDNGAEPEGGAFDGCGRPTYDQWQSVLWRCGRISRRFTAEAGYTMARCVQFRTQRVEASVAEAREQLSETNVDLLVYVQHVDFGESRF